ncbi:hypothetical protein [Paraburkholderia sp. BCC1885]|jgi:hypothetical protein|uniref:hypothetical protein n=1 Tax=Paraburkholderia sp. BCC1885 TaxID=2562669 RepID=UPI001183F2BF|nr:hypothetical protein [Paraburkholderia sp. BCC1885]
MQVSNPVSSLTGNTSNNAPSNVGGGGSGTGPTFQSLLGQLTNYVNETPQQRMEASILAQLGITPQQLQNMTPAERQKVEDEVKELMKKEIQAQQQQQQAQPQMQQAQQTANSQGNSSSKHNTTINITL